ncbi:uncharacterized protein K452DRAFT_293256 [Aplosporella prunicola CBS 121167]|uniref:polynucleotide adenylyltransferase n=1 Tax=Aplosporella prunicola CBS 121167 TaxID=1176127 RepID=A0A6A6AX67_9PEZI|nr:uncharacterized protein K452DRAFT_293256 [Aplosporella prunicola CBS 121167]KAF2135387.1 hypothetical protein K452DRAFT_293256 [Aplosporella prunicola CBS 121167]
MNPPSSLEDQLRSMILNNSPLTPTNPPQAIAQPQSAVPPANYPPSSNVSADGAALPRGGAGAGRYQQHRSSHGPAHGRVPSQQSSGPEWRSRGPPPAHRGSPHHRGHSVPHQQFQESPVGSAASPRAPRHQPPRGRGYAGPPHGRNHSTQGVPSNSASPQQSRMPWSRGGSHPQAAPYPGCVGASGGVPPTAPGHPVQILQRPQQPAASGSPNPSPGFQGRPLNNGYRQPYQIHTKHQLEAQCNYLDGVATVEIPKVAMSEEELNEKQSFVDNLEKICQTEIALLPDVPSLDFKCFGSIGTGFATKGSDIDLAVVASEEENTELAKKAGPRALEKIFLDKGFGARLLTHTRVPIIKFCEKPSDELHTNLLLERKKWDDLPEDEKEGKVEPQVATGEGEKSSKADEAKDSERRNTDTAADGKSASPSTSQNNELREDKKAMPKPSTPGMIDKQVSFPEGNPQDAGEEKKDVQSQGQQRHEKPWLREKPLGPLDFPKDGVGIQCDLNFSGHLGIYNTKLLHCYSISDQRVREMVIFVKAWAKTRKVNSSYNGTLSSYGYSLMVLHYLMRIPADPVIRDLQLDNTQQINGRRPTWIDVTINGVKVKFWGDEEYITAAARKGQWTLNRESLGSLLRGFFRYYGCPGHPDRVGGFHWTRDVITFGQRMPWERLVTKNELGWTQARTEQRDNAKEVRHRYLVAIQDPFELNHNVGRTVTHQGICAIREEFRRAWRILEAEAAGQPHKQLFASIDDDPPPPQTVLSGAHRHGSGANDAAAAAAAVAQSPGQGHTPARAGSGDARARQGSAAQAKAQAGLSPAEAGALLNGVGAGSA